MSIASIMVVINPTTAEQRGFDLGLRSALITGAKLNLYVCLSEANCGTEGEPSAASEHNADSKDFALASYQQRLDELVKQAEAEGVKASSEVEWDNDWSHAIVKAAQRNKSDMMFKTSRDHSRAERGMRETSDWVVLRSSPCPVLMVKGHRDWSHRRVLAAINTGSEDAAHIALNNAIIEFSSRLAEAYGSEVHYVTAVKNQQPAADNYVLAAQCSVPVTQIHSAEGWPEEVIKETADRLEADLVVIGNVGRKGMVASAIGNTAEKLLDQTRSDVFVINGKS